MQENIKIQLNSKSYAYGSLLKPKKKANQLIIFVHGFLSNSEHHLQYNAAKYFRQNNYATFRYNLYGPEGNARKLGGSGLLTLAKDLTKIVSSFRKTFPQIIIVSHSLGVYITLLANPKGVSRLVFWEPSLPPWEMFKAVKKDGLYYYFDLGYEARVPREAIDITLNLPNLKVLLASIRAPVCIVCAEKTGVKTGRLFFSLATKPVTFKVIENAGHNFSENDTELRLFETTTEGLSEPRLSQ